MKKQRTCQRKRSFPNAGEFLIPCRTCDTCVARRIKEWVYRGMMEKAVVRDVLSVTLTYANDTEAQRAGALQFNYSHVQQFLQNLRDVVDERLGHEGGLRYLVGGEVGDRFKRVHWHILLFSEVSLTECGEWSAPWGVETRREKLVSTHGERVKPVHWSLWGHGTVTAQDPDAGGMRYALAYALKDQFGILESAGTARQAKAEFDAAGYFRQSRLIPIGVRFVRQRLEVLAERGAVDPMPRLSVPGMDWPWNVGGVCRREYLEGLALINERVKADTGKNAAGWSSLVAACKESPKSLAALGLGEVGPVWDETDDERIRADGRFRQGEVDAARLHRRCGSTMACSLCLRGQSDQRLAEKGVMFLTGGRFADIGQWIAAGGEGYETWHEPQDADTRKALGRVVDGFAKLQNDAGLGHINPDCCLKGTKAHRLAFPLSGRDDSVLPLLGSRRGASRR